MSVVEEGEPCETDIEQRDTVNPDSVSVSDTDKITLHNTKVNVNAPSVHVEDKQNDSELLKGLLTDTFCQVCEAVLLFESQRVSHYEGKKHAQRVRIYLQSKKAEKNKQSQESCSFHSGKVNPEKHCELCNMVFSSPVVARSHYEGKIHAKNMKKSDTAPSTDSRTTASPDAAVPPVPTKEGAAGVEADDDQEESAASATQEVDLSDPDKYCKLCTASFNNPIMAQQHYSGRKHQRNHARQEMLNKFLKDSEQASSLTCQVCNVTLSSVETYQAHMQGSKHYAQEKKITGLCKSQKKVYDSFQDELADYIQVQKARGLEPKRGAGSEASGQRKTEEGLEESEEFEEEHPIRPHPPSPLPCRPPPPFRPPHNWRSPFQPRTGYFGFRGRFPVQHQWGQGYPSYPPPLIPGLTGRSLRRGRKAESSSSSFSCSDSSSYSSSSSSSSDSSSSSNSSRDRRRRRRKIKERIKRRREQDEDSEKDKRRGRNKKRQRRESEEVQGHAKKARRQKGESFAEEQGTDEDKERRKQKDKKHREGDSSLEDDCRSKRVVSKKRMRRKERNHRKRQREDEGEVSKGCVEEGMDRGDGGMQSVEVQDLVVEHTEERNELTMEKPRHKKEKKKAKDELDNRTEEEKLWDESILGML
ncbi:zinc finger matrin-type protein 1 isoform X2 [Hoplias malabaricus]|uniref:zinc finger matrin-type protein 1 isoform X2 n=1 Tax=Hoplias malabaricus TaxID=27720 RepID=UPI0034633C58